MTNSNDSLIDLINKIDDSNLLFTGNPLHRTLQVLQSDWESIKSITNRPSEICDNETDLRVKISEAIRAPNFGKYSSGEPRQIDLIIKAIRPYLATREPVSIKDIGEKLRAESWTAPYQCERLCEFAPCQCADDYAKFVLKTAGVKYVD